MGRVKSGALSYLRPSKHIEYSLGSTELAKNKVSTGTEVVLAVAALTIGPRMKLGCRYSGSATWLKSALKCIVQILVRRHLPALISECHLFSIETIATGSIIVLSGTALVLITPFHTRLYSSSLSRGLECMRYECGICITHVQLYCNAGIVGGTRSRCQ
jgi:hypothetical protein